MSQAKGTYTAIVTPFRDGAIDQPALETLIQRQLDAGVDGLVPCGTTGESPTLSPDEHRQVVSTTVRMARGKAAVYAGSGTNCTAKTIELARLNAELGVDGLLVVAPYYNKPPQEGLFQHFSAVAAATDRPIMLYNIPGRCGVEVSVETIVRLRASCPTLGSVKHATGSVTGAADLMAACDAPILSGDDPITLPLMSIGAVGVVSVLSNLAPRTVKRMTDAALCGEWRSAREIHAKLYALGKTLLSLDTNPAPIKAALSMFGLCSDELRLPMIALAAEKRAALERVVGEFMASVDER